jgi:hypothetical protein
MKTRALRMMKLAKSKRKRSNHKGPMRRRVKRSRMGPKLKLRAFTLKILTWILAIPNQNPAFQPNRIRRIRPKNILKILKACLKLKLVVQK